MSIHGRVVLVLHSCVYLDVHRAKVVSNYIFHPDVVLRADVNRAQHDGPYTAIKSIVSLDGVLFMQKYYPVSDQKGASARGI